MKKLFERALCCLLLCLTLVGLTACSMSDDEFDSEDYWAEDEYEDDDESLLDILFGDDEPNTSSIQLSKPSAGNNVTGSGEQNAWTICWYLCGSDLESENGCATEDLSELLQIEMPENVKIVIETGGAYEWQNDFVDPDKLQRYVYSNEGLYLADEQESANMGDPQTLADFLYFAKTNYPADKYGVIFWNHGGGTLSGAAFDEVYDGDSLSLLELYSAFDAVWPANPSNPPVELIGFDTCLMSTIDTADYMKEFAKYLVASEECEPGNGWDYTGWADALAYDPSIDGAALGRVICDSYFEGCQAVGTEDEATLALIDLSKIPALVSSYEAMGREALEAAAADPGFFAQLGRTAATVENYGGNTKDSGYTDMMDLGHLARQTAWMLPSAQGVSDALADCVLYSVNGNYRTEATGLSCYYCYDGDVDNFVIYGEVGTGLAFKYLFAYLLTGEVSDSAAEYLSEYNIGELSEPIHMKDQNWDGIEPMVSEDGSVYIVLGEEAADVLADIGFGLFYVDPDEDLLLCMGVDNEIECDWDNGIFSYTSRGVWGAINDFPVYMELTYGSEAYNLYSVPILLNGKEYCLKVYYDFEEEEWGIMGASEGLEDNGMASKELRQLKNGDVIEVIWKASDLSSEDDDMENVPVEKITVDENLTFGEAQLMDGSYCVIMYMEDAAGNLAVSEAQLIELIDGEAYPVLD